MPRRTKIGIHLTLKPTVSRERIAALPIEDQAELAYDVLGGIADHLAECGIAPDLVAHAATDLGYKLTKLAGGPPRVFRFDRPKRDAS